MMAYREFVDGDGVAWRAWETRPGSGANVRPALAAGWVSFESADERRRLAPVPEGWDGLSDEDLLGWLASASPTARSDHGDDAGKAGRPEGGGPTAAVLRRARAVLSSVEDTLRRARRSGPPG
jgi:hypothetical protein